MTAKAAIVRHINLALAALILCGIVIGCSPIFVKLSEVGATYTTLWLLSLALTPIEFLLSRDPGKEGKRTSLWRDCLVCARRAFCWSLN